ncbi:MAG: N-acetylmuramoyl-L-alanine amidase [Rhodobacteraceae bacterium]|nr:N-acetylmuramoyl-L-alanine amidase [Paracoccaceae bacterium]
MSRFLFILAVVFGCFGAGASAQGFGALARVEAEARITDKGQGLDLNLPLSQGVPWRLYTLDAPRRVVLDFREVDWSGLPRDFDRAETALSVRTGGFQPGWSRMVIELARPLSVTEAGMRVDPVTNKAILKLRLTPTDAESFALAAGAPHDPRWDLPPPAAVVPKRKPDGPFLVVLDPGHGGIDPGAEREGVNEKSLMLTFAKELTEELRRAGLEVVLTRDEDVFVSLEGRVAIAHEVRADLFLSLHADALSEGQATGTTLHLLSRSASDEATALLAERHDRDELLSGVDLTGQDDEVASILMDLARAETEPRAEALAQSLLGAIKADGLPLAKRSLRRGAFSVLKAADIPSILIEVGFMSSPRDLANLRDAGWRTRLAVAIRGGILEWIETDQARAPLVRQ